MGKANDYGTRKLIVDAFDHVYNTDKKVVFTSEEGNTITAYKCGEVLRIDIKFEGDAK